MSLESILIWLLVGAIAGWLAGVIVKGYGFGLIGNIIIGVVGAFVGGWLFGLLGFANGSGLLGLVFGATIGAVVVLLVIRLLRRGA